MGYAYAGGVPLYPLVGRSKPETNAIDTQLGTTAAALQVTATPPAGSLVLINSIAAGDDINNRDGREVMLKSFEVRGIIYEAAGAAAHAASLGRILVVYDNQPNGAAPANIDILSDTAATAISDTNPAGVLFMNLNNRKRFKVLAAEDYSFGTVGASNVETEAAYPVSIYRKCNLPCVFSSSSSGIGAITTGALYVFLVGTTGAAGAGVINFFGRARVRFQG